MFIKPARINAIRSLFNKAFGKYKRQIIVLILLGFLSGILEGIGINALIPLFSLVIGSGHAGNDTISRTIEQFFGFIKIDFNVSYLLLFIMLMFISRALVKVYLDYLRVRITSDYEYTTRNHIYHKILISDWPHLMKQKLGYLENILLIDVPASSLFLREISTVIMLGTSLLVYLLVAINISVIITFSTLILGFFISLILRPLNAKTKVFSHDSANQNKYITHHVTENILGIKTVKSMWAVAGVREKGNTFFLKLRDLKIKVFIIRSIISSFIQPIGVVFICLIFLYTYRSPGFNLAALVAIVYLIDKIFTYLQQLHQSFNIVYEKLPYLQSALEFQERATESEEENSGKVSFSFKHELTFNDISFRYREGTEERDVFSGVSFTLKKGEMVGIIGPSGVGKTTLVDLLLRLLKSESGSITLDGQDIESIDLKSWRQKIGYISQDIYLMNDTIANNIKFYDDSISDEQLIKVAQMANIYEFIDSLPDKFNTIIGDRGIRLSAGQRQRVVIARILSRNPEILVLDEATSALDNESEFKIQRVIQGLKGSVTVLAIAHRLTTVEDSDKLLVLENGRISEQGSPRELLKNKDSYFFKTYNLRK